MKFEEYVFTASEITQLEELLGELPEDMAIERMGLEDRLARAKGRISGIEPPRVPKRARLTFRGRPIHDSSGMDADFGAKAMGVFSDALTLAAASSTSDLKSTGPIPNREQSRPLITGIATRSFGFEFEIPSVETESAASAVIEHAAERALRKIQQLLTAASCGSDDDLSELANEIHPRTMRKVSELLGLMRRHSAWFALEFDGSEFRFTGSEDVVSSAERLNSDNIIERQEDISGTLHGLMPEERWFELKRHDNGKIIEGKIGPEMRNASTRLREYFDQKVEASISSVQVGRGSPRYTLRGIRAFP